MGGHGERTPERVRLVDLQGSSECPQLFSALGHCPKSAQHSGHRGASGSVTVAMAQTHLSLGLGRNSKAGANLPLK